MAEKTEKKTAAKTEQAAATAVQESVYSADELAANAKKVFSTRRECVEAALRAAGKTSWTVSEAKKVVEAFLKKEVK